MSEERVFSHGGDNGDLIAALPTIWQLGGGKLVLYPAACTGYRMTKERAEGLIPLLELQPYLTSVEWREGPEGLNLDDWRGRYINGYNLSDICASKFGVHHWPRERPWIFVPSVKRVAKVVFHRSPRYHNWNMVPVWKRAIEEYRLDAVFVGSPHEHAEFVTYLGPVAYYPTKDYLELARVIAGAEFYMGNQSSPWWLAEALKMPSCLEVAVNTANCHFHRWGNIYGVNDWTGLPSLGELPDRWATTMTKKAEDRTLVSEDRLRVIAWSVRETERLGGDMAELGAYRGGSAKVIGTVGPSRRLHVFDTFSGLPCDDIAEGVHKTGEFACPRDEVEAFLKGLNVELHEGIFPATAAGLEDRTFSFVHLDADLFDSTLAALKWFWPRMVSGGLIVLDDFDWPACPGVRKALEETGLIGMVEKTTEFQGRLRKP